MKPPPGPHPRLLCTWKGSGRSAGQVVGLYRRGATRGRRKRVRSQRRRSACGMVVVGWVGRSPRPRRRRGARSYGQGRTPTPLRRSYRPVGARTATHLHAQKQRIVACRGLAESTLTPLPKVSSTRTAGGAGRPIYWDGRTSRKPGRRGAPTATAPPFRPPSWRPVLDPTSHGPTGLKETPYLHIF